MPPFCSACSPKLPAGADVLMLGRQANALEASDLAVLQARHGRARCTV